MVSKAQALARFINDRVVGNKPLALHESGVGCRYSHQYNGGCALGCLATKEICTEADYNTTSANAFAILAGFEDPSSAFWPALQFAHDSLANLKHGGDRWKQFANSLHVASKLS